MSTQAEEAPEASAGSSQQQQEPQHAHGPADARHPQEEGSSEYGHTGLYADERLYLKVGAVLALLTVLEGSIYYIKGLGYTANPAFVILAATKFFLVAAFFMHLRTDNKILRRVFVTGLVLAATVYVIVLLTLGVFTTTRGAHG
jgi:cytochrome c oxidase subunit 4